MEQAVKTSIRYPELRVNVKCAVEELSDREIQEKQWLQPVEGKSYIGSLDLAVHVLYDDMEVLPEPEGAVGSVIYNEEVASFRALNSVFDPILEDLGDQSDEVYIRDPRWRGVVEAAARVYAVMEACDRQYGGDG